eukprot:TRINITY_DN7094_c0_g6_i2.p1 TRINITY_DN7094_c0_g6~~TRINITY_DN7094_c0_g6_i2.p1  ORF type:complete len:305 (+),score=41.86 TRINITY_DN7094_c0_g6_i2:54-968(+)
MAPASYALQGRSHYAFMGRMVPRASAVTFRKRTVVKRSSWLNATIGILLLLRLCPRCVDYSSAYIHSGSPQARSPRLQQMRSRAAELKRVATLCSHYKAAGVEANSRRSHRLQQVCTAIKEQADKTEEDGTDKDWEGPADYLRETGNEFKRLAFVERVWTDFPNMWSRPDVIVLGARLDLIGAVLIVIGFGLGKAVMAARVAEGMPALDDSYVIEYSGRLIAVASSITWPATQLMSVLMASVALVSLLLDDMQAGYLATLQVDVEYVRKKRIATALLLVLNAVVVLSPPYPSSFDWSTDMSDFV